MYLFIIHLVIFIGGKEGRVKRERERKNRKEGREMVRMRAIARERKREEDREG